MGNSKDKNRENAAGANSVRFWRYPEIGNIELLHAVYQNQVFSPHFHEGHVIGVIEKGALGFDYRGQKVAAAAGEINMADPGEVHNGFALSGRGWEYRMFYLSPGYLDSISDEMADTKTDMPFFKRGVVRDRRFAEALGQLHRDFDNPQVSLLEKESRFRLLLSGFILKHVNGVSPPIRPGIEPVMVSRVKSYIRARCREPVSLQELSRHAGVSKYYLLRSFARATGLTPHAYLNHTRASNARQMLLKKRPIIDTALAAGFYDQSHLNRIFKKIYGITPGQFVHALS
jgi:AraC-like DNA-binding protein